MKKTFSLAEVDTGVLDHFFQSCARGDFGGAASLAQVILDHSKNDEMLIRLTPVTGKDILL